MSITNKWTNFLSFLCLVFFFAFLPFTTGWAQNRYLLKQDYTFLVTDGGETRILHQSGDTLFIFDGHVGYEDHPQRIGQCFKILSVRREEGFVFLKMKTLPNPQHPVKYRQKATFSECGIREISKDKLELAYWGFNTIKAGLYAENIPLDSLEHAFNITFYSESKIQEFKQMKPVRTVGDTKAIMGAFMRDMRKLRDSITKMNGSHNYLSGFLPGDLLTKACLSEGYNPLGAGNITDGIMKSHRQQLDSLMANLKAAYEQKRNQPHQAQSKIDKAPQVPAAHNNKDKE